MSNKDPVQHSVRPPSISSKQEGGPVAAVDRKGQGEKLHRCGTQRLKAVFPFGKTDGDGVEELTGEDEL